MTHFAIIAPPLRGHYDPLSSLAAELIERGHRITFIHQEEARGLVGCEQAGFEAIGQTARSVVSWTSPMSKIRGLLGLDGMMRRMRDFTDLLCREAPSVLRRIGADAIIADQLEPAGSLIAQHLGLPWISAAVALPMNREMGVPPPFVPWTYDPSPRGIGRNRGSWRVTDMLMRVVNAGIARNAAMLGLPPHRKLEDCFSPILQISQLIPELDFPRQELPGNFYYTGPWRHGPPGVSPIRRSDGRTTVYATFGTLQGSRVGLFEIIAEACRRCDFRLAISRGRAAAFPGNFPGDTTMFDWVPQRALLSEVDLVVAHAGLNTMLDAMSAGVPMVLVPLAFEQPAIAARVVRRGAGVMVKRSARVNAFVAAMRHAELCRPAAARMATEIGKSGGAARAADLIELAIGRTGIPAAIPTTERAARDDVRDGNRSGSS